MFDRRPNPIPILAPPDHKKPPGNPSSEDSGNNADNEKGTSSAENIDHILDNMFVQRQPYEPTISLKETQTPQAASDEKSDEQLNEGMNVSRSLTVFLKAFYNETKFSQAMTVGGDEKADAK